MKILMTGGTGFIGPHLAARLIQEGHEVTILARPSEEKNALPREPRCCKVILHAGDRGRRPCQSRMW